MSSAGSAPAGRVVLVTHTTAYGVEAFLEAARRVGVGVVIASDRCPILDGAWQWPRDSWVIDFFDVAGAAEIIADHAGGEQAIGADGPVRAVLPVGGEVPARVAALAARRLGLPGNDPDAVAVAANKLRLRARCAAARDQGQPLVVPRFLALAFDEAPARVVDRVAADIGWPCVLKPLLLSASRGVMRADDPASFCERFARLARMLGRPELLEMDAHASRLILVESFVPGPEVALEGLLFGHALHPLALFDKPDPLDGPFFEETIYVTPSRLPAARQAEIHAAVLTAARAIGLHSGPVHAELRLGGAGGPVVIDLAARPIGGLCSRALRFVRDAPLEELVIRQALGQDVRALARERAASGVMMLPIPRAGILRAVAGVDGARAVPGIEDLVISVRPGERVLPLPEGASYLGFIFARGESPAAVEAALREANDRLTVDIAPRLPTGIG
ncbi:MAG TPA: ATP-grasp domain-containing protein [Polyangia bacterium]|nr:ATP-grasp domain-containing protein [Polyangia bacterium]